MYCFFFLLFCMQCDGKLLIFKLLIMNDSSTFIASIPAAKCRPPSIVLRHTLVWTILHIYFAVKLFVAWNAQVGFMRPLVMLHAKIYVIGNFCADVTFPNLI